MMRMPRRCPEMTKRDEDQRSLSHGCNVFLQHPVGLQFYGVGWCQDTWDPDYFGLETFRHQGRTVRTYRHQSDGTEMSRVRFYVTPTKIVSMDTL